MNAGDRAFILGCTGLIIQNCGHGDASNWIGFAMAVVGFAGSMIIPPLKASPPLASEQHQSASSPLSSNTRKTE